MTEPRRVVAHETMFLDHTVPQFFSANRYLATLTRKLWEHGIRRVGQLIQLTEKDLLDIAPRTAPSTIDSVVATLARVDLKLGMDSNGWKNPEASPRRPAPKRPKRAAAAHSTRNAIRRKA